MPRSIAIANAGAGRNQVLRTALGLAAASGVPLRLTGLVDDGARPQPGLGPGHHTSLAAAAIVSGGRFSARLGEEEAQFEPRQARPGDYSFDVARERRCAAPVSWVAEAVWPALALADGKSQLLLSGGTHVLGGLSTDMMSLVLAPLWGLMGVKASCGEIAPGFHPQGGGEAEIRVAGQGQLRPLIAEGPFKLAQAGVEVVLSGLPVHLAEQALEGAVGRLALHGLSPATRLRRAQGGGHGMCVLVWARDAAGVTVGFSALGRRGGRPEAVALEAVEALASFLHSGAGLTAELAAFLMAPMALAQGMSRLSVERPTPGLKAAARAVESLWPGTVRLLEGSQGGAVEIRVQGRGLAAKP